MVHKKGFSGSLWGGDLIPAPYLIKGDKSPWGPD